MTRAPLKLDGLVKRTISYNIRLTLAFVTTGEEEKVLTRIEANDGSTRSDNF